MSEALAILEPAATRVRDPRSGRSIWMAGLIAESELDGETLRFAVVLSDNHTDEEGMRMLDALTDNLRKIGFEGPIDGRIGRVKSAPTPPAPPQQDPVVGMSGSGTGPHGGPFVKNAIGGVRDIIAVASGKGGVGKSTVSTNLAISLSRKGLRVGLMDADIYGPSLPTMMNIRGRPIADEHKRITPLEAYGIRCMSMGFLVPEKEAIIWRGPMVMGAVRQLLHDVNWGELDVLVVDLPPGTGDAQLTMVQTVPVTGAVVVTTPQKVAVIDAERAISMFRKLDVPVLGLIENMAWMDLPDGSRTHPFGSGGGVQTAADYQVPLLAQVPFDARICQGGDNGIPAATRGDGPGEPFLAVGEAVFKALRDEAS